MKFLMIFTQNWDINMKNKFFKHLKVITKHRYIVFKLCVKCGFVWRGLVHDLSKFSPVEFFEGVKYYTGVGSPIANCRKHNGYSLAWLHHKGRNKHHIIYWYDRGNKVQMDMPFKYAVECACDIIAASKCYNGKKYKDDMPYNYWKNHMNKNVANENMKKFFDRVLSNIRDYGEDKVLKKKYLKKLYDELVVNGEFLMKDLIKINCHSSICIDEKYYFDPFQIKEEKHNAEIIFITHSHFDHLEIASIEKIIKDDTVIVCTKDSVEILEKEFKNKIVVVKPNEKGEAKGIQFETFPAYNYGHHHFKELGYVGYTIKLYGNKFTICGDTDATEELKKIKTDVLLLPIGGTYTMNPEEAGELVNIIKPRLAIPTHYGCISGTFGKDEAEERFLKIVDKNIPVEILIK